MNNETISREALIALSLKHNGNFYEIYQAIVNKEPISVSEIIKYTKQLEYNTITMLDDDYPIKLKELTNPPIVLYYEGNPTLFDDANANLDIDTFSNGIRLYSTFNESLEQPYMIACENHEYLKNLMNFMKNMDNSLNEINQTLASNRPEPDEIKVLIIEPDKHPYEATIPNKLKSFQSIVGGHIEEVYIDDHTAIICNDEGKINNLKANRSIGNDIIAGTFIICKAESDVDFWESLDDNQILKFTNMFFDVEEHDQSELLDKLKFNFHII
ncbi:MAG: DUF3846 domain-containing protein [Erysipelotrichaceae bacterium]|nr:DUF3846 domain-containing protein [Erysipelotrichaceae bacterium]